MSGLNYKPKRNVDGRFAPVNPQEACRIEKISGRLCVQIHYPKEVSLPDIAKGDQIVGWKERKKRFSGLFDQAFSLLPNGRVQGLQYLELARQHIAPDGTRPNARFDALLEAWANLSPLEHIGTSVDQLCRDAGIDPSDAIGTAVMWGVQHGVAVSKVVAAALLPREVEAVARRAQANQNGHMDARIIGEATGFLPSAKGALVNQQFNLNAEKIAKDTDESVAAEGLALPAFEADTVEACVVVAEDRE